MVEYLRWHSECPTAVGFFWEPMGSVTQRIAFPEFIETVPR